MTNQMDSSAVPGEFALYTQSERGFVCACEEWMRSACAGEGFFSEHEGRSYCVLHYPNQDKAKAFNSVLQKKLEAKDFDFRGVWFPEGASFSKVQFNAPADFSGAIFSGVANFFKAVFIADTRIETVDVSFNNAAFRADADFRFARFNIDADFAKTQYSGIADFSSAKFRRSVFGAAKFSSNAIFSFAKFDDDAFFYSANFGATTKFQETIFNSRVDFSNATFSADADFASVIFTADVDFNHATFASYVRFAGNKDHPVFGDCSYLNLQHARIEKPERISFHTLSLRPYWFVNADASKFKFVNVKWPQSQSLMPEIESLDSNKVQSPHNLLSIAFRQLAVNAEENHRYYEASRFRYFSLETSRLEKQRLPIRGKWKDSAYLTLLWLYWKASGYGERVGQAFLVFFLLLFAFFFAYKAIDYTVPATQSPSVAKTARKLGWGEAAIYSLEVAFLQKPEPKPLTNAGRLLVLSEMVLAPTQAALLALAIRRKFMR